MTDCLTNPTLNLCLVTPEVGKTSETFIDAHIRYLSQNTHVLHGNGSNFPHFTDTGERIRGKHSVQNRILRSIYRRLGFEYGKCLDDWILARYLERHRFDVILAEYGPTGAAILEACKLSRLPLVVHFHGYDAYKTDLLLRMGSKYAHLFEHVSAIIAGSRDMIYQLESMGAPSDLIHYNACGVELSVFSPTNPAQNPPVFLSVGRFVDKKSPLLALMAFSRMHDVVPDTRLTMIGDGPLLECCQRFAEASGILDKVDFRGACSQIAVADAMQGARAFVQHSVRPRVGLSAGDSEATAITVLEAGATALPVVGTRHGGIADSILDGETGFLVEEGDVKAMAAHMKTLARDPKLAERMGRAGRARVEAEFAMQSSISNLRNILEKACGKKY